MSTTAASDLDALLAAVKAEREDDAPRLILADYLDERGWEWAGLLRTREPRQYLDRRAGWTWRCAGSSPDYAAEGPSTLPVTVFQRLVGGWRVMWTREGYGSRGDAFWALARAVVAAG